MTHENSSIFTILMIYLGIYGVILVGYAISYVFRGIGMYTLGKRRGMNNCWLAFIPYARKYFQGELCGPLKIKNKAIDSPGIWLIILPFVSGIITGAFSMIAYVSLFGSAIGLSLRNFTENNIEDAFGSYMGSGIVTFLVMLIIVLLISTIMTAIVKTLEALVNQRIFSAFATHEVSLIHAVIGLFVPFYTSVYFFIIRNKAPIGYTQ